MFMKKLPLLLPAILYSLYGCNGSESTSTTTSMPQPQISACPVSGGGEEGEYSPADQKEYLAGILAGKNDDIFQDAFEQGDVIFGTNFTLEQGGGANIDSPINAHYTRIPRADLTGPGQWADPQHIVTRPTGPNAQSCKSCHSQPAEDGAGPTAANVHRDPHMTTRLDQMIQRNTPHLFGAGALQRLAEEMTQDLMAIKDATGKKACASRASERAELRSKGVSFGHITMICPEGSSYKADDSAMEVEGIAPDLVVRPYEWKKSVTFLRDFMRHAGNNEIGMQAVELAGKGVDDDGDGKADELSVGDITAFTIYMAAQPRPTTKLELDSLGLLKDPKQRLRDSDRKQIQQGEDLFKKAGCDTCHKPQLALDSAIFQEPSASASYRDKEEDFNKKDMVQVNLLAEGVDPKHPLKFDLSRDQPDNLLCRGKEKIRLGAFEKQGGKTVVRLYGDLKRHWMGDDLAEPVDELQDPQNPGKEYGNGYMGLYGYDPKDAVIKPEAYAIHPDRAKATFGTKELWGVACTGPWMHDGRATSLREAIQLHGGEAAKSREQFGQFTAAEQKNLIAFLGNLVIYFKKGDDPTVPDGLSPDCEITDLAGLGLRTLSSTQYFPALLWGAAAFGAHRAPNAGLAGPQFLSSLGVAASHPPKAMFSNTQRRAIMCDHHHSTTGICFIIPPRMLEHLASHAEEMDMRRRALQNMQFQGHFRGMREGVSMFGFHGGVGVGGKRRTIYDAGRRQRPGTLVRSEGQAASSDIAVNEAYDYSGATYDFYQQVFGRVSVDNRGKRLDSTVHYGRAYDNAFWDGRQMIYGDGDGRIFDRFTKCLDVIGHELTHGVTQFTAGLEYQDQSGALNESMSDVFGSLIKQFAANETAQQADWLIGEGLLIPKPGNIRTALRSMKEPGTAYRDSELGTDSQPAHMRDYYDGEEDNGGVHINSGIPNHAFYLAAVKIGGHAWDVAGRIWYEVLTTRLHAQSQFADAAAETRDVAKKYGAAAATAVDEAWKAVGL
jgi:hypothetical protein